MTKRTTVKMRRQPSQERGELRVSRLLDAAEQVFAEVGYAAATTNQIAAQAEASIGSLYQFFPNKAALLDAVAERYRAGLRQAFDAAFSPEDVQRLSLAEIANRLIEVAVRFGGEHIGFTHIALQSQSTPELAAAAAGLHQDIRDRVVGLLAARAPRLSQADRERGARVIQLAVNAVMAEAVGEKLAGRERQGLALIAEAKRLMEVYLAAVERHSPPAA
jgi:AcrR family transcriptional regulator